MHDKKTKPDSSQLFAWDKDAAVALINSLGELAMQSGKFPELASRDGRKRILGNLGVNADTAANYRMIVYQDAVQEVYLFGAMQDNGSLRITHSAVVPKKESTGDLPRVRALVDGHLKALPAPIEISSAELVATKREASNKEPGAASEKLKLTEEASRRLATQVTLLALAEHATRNDPCAYNERSNACLPNLVTPQPGRSA
jgi:hypothetical protein